MKTIDFSKIKNFVIDNLVVIIFVSFTVLGFILSGGAPILFFLNELIDRVFRNFFLVLSLIIPIVAGLGLNFGIVIGAMVGQGAIIFTRYQYEAAIINGTSPAAWSGITGLIISFLLAFPFAVFCGWLTGKLFNRVRGQEMIASLIVGYFATGIFLFIMLFAIGIIIPVTPGHPMIKFDNIGIRVSVDLGFLDEGGMKFALDNIARVPVMHLILAGSLIALGILIFKRVWNKKKNIPITANPWWFRINVTLCAIGIIFSLFSIITNNILMVLRGVPLVTGLVMLALCLFLHFLMKTKLGQDFRSVGQNQHIAEVSGINVDRTRIIATIYSTVLAAWGMIIFLQNMGTIATYDAFRNIGLFSVATILVGGASTSRAGIKNAVLGVILFNAMTIISPELGLALFRDPGSGEYFRSFIVYGVIGLALGIHVWRQNKTIKDLNKL